MRRSVTAIYALPTLIDFVITPASRFRWQNINLLIGGKTVNLVDFDLLPAQAVGFSKITP
jgi:hypothetical protein